MPFRSRSFNAYCRFECGEGAHDDSVGAAVGDVATCNEDHEEGWFREFRGGGFGGAEDGFGFIEDEHSAFEQAETVETKGESVG